MPKIIRTLTILFLVAMITFGNFSVYAQPPHGDGGEEKTETITFDGYCNEGESLENTAELGEISLIEIVFILSWEDDEGSDSDPDSFSLSTDDGMHEPKSKQSSNGEISIFWDEHGLNDTWNMVVVCEDAGPTPVGPLGMIVETDPGNSWTLVVTYTYTESGGGPGGPPAYIQEVLASPVFKVHIALMIASVFLFLATGLIAGVFLFTRYKWSDPRQRPPILNRLFGTPILVILLVILAFIAFFIAAVPIGMWVAGMFYGWDKAWTGFPAIWNEDPLSLNNADNVSLIVLVLWAVPMYLNRAQILRSKYFKKLFGWSRLAMKRAEKAPNPKLGNTMLAVCYFFMGIFIYVVFMVQPHGSGS